MASLTDNDIITASGRYPARAKDPQLTDAVKANISELRRRVNGLLADLGWIPDPDCTSGFRPAAANTAAGGATKSAHMLGEALDIMDNAEQVLARLIMADAEKNKENSLLHKWDLWLEHPDYTKGKVSNWCHLDMKSRRERPVQVFKP
jgi:hypothetical protein